MSHTETRVVTTTGEVVLLSGRGDDRRLCAIAQEIHQRTRALVVVDHVGDLQLSKLDRDEMRRHGWVSLDELEAALRERDEARAAAVPR